MNSRAGGLLPQVADVRHTVALAIAKVAAIEIPKAQWPELISTLLANMNVQPPNPGLRTSTMEALGYVCEELGNMDEDYLEQAEVNSILTAVAQGMRKEEGSVDVRHAATVALTNALEFASTNFGNDNERNYIMQIVCEATIAGELALFTADILGAASQLEGA
jgi:importin subunit beta-1